MISLTGLCQLNELGFYYGEYHKTDFDIPITTEWNGPKTVPYVDVLGESFDVDGLKVCPRLYKPTAIELAVNIILLRKDMSSLIHL